MVCAPVGRFPKGASPYRVHDLMGNVWEWVAEPLPDRFLSDKVRRPDPDLRLQKGGAWRD
ncbi:MAG: SUMF1/EgtB/PvdO family nonheme iron enzyme [Nitrospinota bacterium]|nr:SUMF1/EgtB/PvdO family nonheme iron enzyme [Nitrospinota bacterium]